MGVAGLWPAFGITAKKNHEDSMCKVDMRGKKVGIELSGLLNPLVFALGREHRYAKDLSRHCRGKALENPDLVVRVAAGAIDHIKEISRLCDSVVIVGGGNYVLMEHDNCQSIAIQSHLSIIPDVF
jgi:hypothetical protein